MKFPILLSITLLYQRQMGDSQGADSRPLVTPQTAHQNPLTTGIRFEYDHEHNTKEARASLQDLRTSQEFILLYI